MKKKILIIISNYYKDVGNSLLKGATHELKKNKIKYDILHAPGCFEIPFLISKNVKKYKGFIFGLFLTYLFTIRVLVEYVKESQGGFEESLGILSTGQWLSIPFILIGIILMIYSRKNQIKLFF